MKFLLIINLHCFSDYNRTYGWESGDKILEKVAKIIKEINPNDLIFRLHGDYFVVLDKNQIDYEKYIDYLENSLDDTVVTISHQYFNMNEKNIKTLKDIEDILE